MARLFTSEQLASLEAVFRDLQVVLAERGWLNCAKLMGCGRLAIT